MRLCADFVRLFAWFRIQFQYRGGAVFNMGGQVSFNAGSMFKSNSASSNGEGGSGGAIYNRNGLIT